jgi:hypothetical protein
MYTITCCRAEKGFKEESLYVQFLYDDEVHEYEIINALLRNMIMDNEV